MQHGEILVRCRVNVGIEVVVTKELVLVMKSRDEVLSVDHAFSMAHNGRKVKRQWTLCNVSSQLVEHSRFTHQHAVDLGCFVSLAFA